MSDGTQDVGQDPDEIGGIEQLLRELDLADLELSTPPADVWAGIEQAVRGDTVLALPTPARHTGRRWLLLAAAAVVALVATAVVVVVERHDPEEVVATAVLTHDAATFDP